MLPREPPGEKKRGLGVITIVIAVSLLLLAVIFVTGQYALYGQVGRLRAQLGWVASHMRYCAPLQMEMRETSSWRGRGARLARDAVRPLAAKCVRKIGARAESPCRRSWVRGLNRHCVGACRSAWATLSTRAWKCA